MTHDSIDYSEVLPDFPRTRHLPWKPNATRDDLIASEKDCQILFDSPSVHVTEKVDGANIGIALIDGEPLIRNRNHILQKSHAARTAAKAQFNPIWNWFYENIKLFEQLNKYGPYSVYGEWLLARHSIVYDRLTSYFAAFDLWDQETHNWIDPQVSDRILQDSGFPRVPGIHVGPITSFAQLESMMTSKSEFSNTSIKEGIYIKLGDGTNLTHRFKMVRQNFISGEHWNKNKIVKNTMRKA